MLSVETYQSLADASQAMGDRARFIAGGTLVMRAVTYGDQGFDRIVRARQTDREITPDAQGVRISAGTTMADILASRDVEFLHAVARSIGGPAIRNMATVGGNLFAQNPYGDLAVALLALDAQIQMVGGQTLAMESFLMDRAHLRELVSAVIVPRVEPNSFLFNKVSRVKPKGVAVMALAAFVGRGAPRIAFGNMGPSALRAKAAERALSNGVDTTSIDGACSVCLEGLAPTTDPLASEWYRREVAPVHLKRLLQSGGHR
ncbi:MAG: FAD binding domain-containing protein [Litoreibacter sp.]